MDFINDSISFQYAYHVWHSTRQFNIPAPAKHATTWLSLTVILCLNSYRHVLIGVLLHIDPRIAYAFAWHRSLRTELNAVCMVTFPSDFLRYTKLPLEKSGFPDILETSLPMLMFVQILLSCSYSLPFLNFSCHVQICIAVGAFLWIFSKMYAAQS